MSAPQLIVLALAAPLAGALGIALTGARPNLREGVSLAAAAVLFAAALGLLAAVAGGARPGLELFEILPGVGLAFRAEPLGAGFAVIVGSLWFITVLYAIGYMRAHHEENQTRFYTFFAIAIAATVGGALAANLLTLYLFYEILTLATWPLVTHGGEAKDRAGGRTYLMVLLGTSLSFLLLAIVWTYAIAGTLEFRPGGVLGGAEGPPAGTPPVAVAVLFALFLFGTGKAALLPFHRWLPAAMVAPTPVSALLHAVAVVKLGVFTILKVTLYIFGLDLLASLEATLVMQYVAAATLLVAAVVALREDNLKRRLAYSTISQLAYIVLAATLANATALAAGGLHIAVHAFAKITLFFCAGAILVSLHKTAVSELAGIGRRMPVTMAAWTIASLCVIGMPLTGGFWSKWYLANGALEAGQPVMLVVILAGSLLAVGYLLPPAIQAFFARPAGAAPVGAAPVGAAPVGAAPAAAAGPEAPLASLIALTVTALASMALFFAGGPIVGFLDTVRH